MLENVGVANADGPIANEPAVAFAIGLSG